MAGLTDKEIFLLEQISRKNLMSQRELAKRTGISLGLINTLLKKLLRSGHIRISYLNKKKLQYQLTYMGLMATTRKTHAQATKTIQNYRQIKEGLSKLLQELHEAGFSYFSIHGDGELRDLLESVFRTRMSEAQATLGNDHLEAPQSVVLNVTPSSLQQGFQGTVISVLEKLGGACE